MLPQNYILAYHADVLRASAKRYRESRCRETVQPGHTDVFPVDASLHPKSYLSAGAKGRPEIRLCSQANISNEIYTGFHRAT